MGRGMSHQKRKKTKSTKNRNKSLDQLKNVKVGRKGGTAAKIREIDVVKFICMRESLVARLKTVTRAMRAVAKKIRFSRIKKDDAPDAKLVLKLESQQRLFRELVSSLRKASVAVVESVQEWRRTIRMEENSRGESVNSIVTFQWQETNYLIKMTKDLAFLRQRRSANILTSSKFKSMTGKERVVALRQDDDRDTICLWCGLDPVTNPLLMLPPGHGVVQQLKEEKAAWDVELNKALHDEAEEIAQEYMRQRAKAQQDFVGRGVLTVDDDGDFKPQDDANNCANEDNADVTGSSDNASDAREVS